MSTTSPGSRYTLTNHEQSRSAIVPPRSTVVGLAICSNAAASAFAPALPIQLPAHPIVQSKQCRAARLHQHRTPETLQTGSSNRGAVGPLVPRRFNVVSLVICGKTPASSFAPSSPISLPACPIVRKHRSCSRAAGGSRTALARKATLYHEGSSSSASLHHTARQRARSPRRLRGSYLHV